MRIEGNPLNPGPLAARPAPVEESSGGSGAAPTQTNTQSAAQPADRAGDDAALNAALREWIEATNSRDVERQMTFYAPRLTAFYRLRGVPRDEVRKEKAGLSERARRVQITTSEPEIRYGRDARTASMRFRKTYAIEVGRETRRGEVIQELVWRRTPDGWSIISERDVSVIR